MVLFFKQEEAEKTEENPRNSLARVCVDRSRKRLPRNLGLQRSTHPGEGSGASQAEAAIRGGDVAHLTLLLYI